MGSLYQRHRFPPEIISHAVWLYHRFTFSFRDVEDLLAERGVSVSYEAIRSWCSKFGLAYARTLRRQQGRLGDIWHVDELFITIRGERHYLWRLLVAVGSLYLMHGQHGGSMGTASVPLAAVRYPLTFRNVPVA
jgi:transposase-like protein